MIFAVHGKSKFEKILRRLDTVPYTYTCTKYLTARMALHTREKFNEFLFI